MTDRELHALALPTGPRLRDAVASAVDGSGPAVLPLDPLAPAAVNDAIVAAMRPHRLVQVDSSHALTDPAPVASEVCLVVATSGSTGAPKGVELSAAALRASAAATQVRLGTDAGQRWLCCLPTSHIAGLQVLTRSIIAGSDPLLQQRFDVDAVARAQAELVSLVPTMLLRLLDAGADLRRWHTILLGGAAAPESLLARAREAGARVVATYGMSETCGGCVYDGVPLNGVTARVRTEDSRIVLSGPMLASGYRFNPALTAEVFGGGELMTGDIGAIGPGGELRVLGRADDAIVTGGVTVAPAEVTGLLAEHPLVAEVAVVGAPDPEWGQRVVAVVVPTDAAHPPELAGLRDHVQGRARREAAPRTLIIVDALPQLPSGKPDRATLRHLAAGPSDASL